VRFESDTSVISSQCTTRKHNEIEVIVSTISDNLNHTEEAGRNRGRRKTAPGRRRVSVTSKLNSSLFLFALMPARPANSLLSCVPVVGPGATWAAAFVVPETSGTTAPPAWLCFCPLTLLWPRSYPCLVVRRPRDAPHVRGRASAVHTRSDGQGWPSRMRAKPAAGSVRRSRFRPGTASGGGLLFYVFCLGYGHTEKRAR
jgi:hypothetical protein